MAQIEIVSNNAEYMHKCFCFVFIKTGHYYLCYGADFSLSLLGGTRWMRYSWTRDRGSQLYFCVRSIQDLRSYTTGGSQYTTERSQFTTRTQLTFTSQEAAYMLIKC